MTTDISALPDEAYIRLPQVAALFGVSKATIWRWAAEGRIPKQRKLSPGVAAWQVGEVRQALANAGAGA